MKTKNCTFCGEPMAPQDKECKQCGWDSSNVKPPAADPGDQRARIFVGLGLAVGYGVLWSLMGSLDAGATPAVASARPVIEIPSEAPTIEPAIAIGASASRDSAPPAVASSPAKLLNIKVADVKGATILPRDAIRYDFTLPETDQNCTLVGQVKSTGGDVEVLLLTDDDFVFWRANPAAIPHSDWAPVRGFETPLSYQLAGPGTYHLIVSNALSGTAHKVVQVKAQVKCTRDPRRAIGQ